MSELRREKQKEKTAASGPSTANWGARILYAVLIVAAFGAAYYLGNRSQHKYDTFAKCLNTRGVQMYGAWWCPHCSDQKEKFGKSFEFVNYIECGVKGDASQGTQVCKDAGIHHFPTWQFPPTGERVERVFELQELSDRTGCALP